MFLQLLANGLVTGSVIALAAVGISIVYGILRLVNFAYGDYLTYGAFTGVLFNVTFGLPIVVAALLAMVATAALSVALEFALWRPLRARSAGFMSLFLASVGLALVLRNAIYWVAGPQQRTYDVDPYKVYVLGSVRLSGSQGIAIVVAAVGLGGIGSAYGALVGGLALGIAMELSTWTSLAGGVDPTYKPVVAFAALVLVLLLRPQGLFGRARVL